MFKRSAVPLMVVIVFSSGLASPCTTVFTARDGVRLAGNNLDCSNVFPRVWFVPGEEGRNGRFCFGTDKQERIAEGGMNDQGLYIAVNALDEDTGWTPDPELPDWEEWEGWFESGVPDGILALCSNVEEAVAVFKRYNLLTLNRVKFLLADRSGASVVIEWTDAGLTVVPRGDAADQVSTNFITSNHGAGQAPCYRYTLAEKMLSEPGWKPAVDSVRAILSATHLEFQTPTVLSSICNLETGEIHLFYFHDFERSKIFDLRRELEAGRHGYLLSELFDPKPFVAKVYEDYSRNTGS